MILDRHSICFVKPSKLEIMHSFDLLNPFNLYLSKLIKVLLTVIAAGINRAFDFALFINPQIKLCPTEKFSYSYISTFHVVVTSGVPLRTGGTVHACS